MLNAPMVPLALQTIRILSHHQYLKAVCGVFGYPKGSAFGASRWHFEAPTLALKFLPCGFPLGLYPGLVMGVIKDSLLLLVIYWMIVVTRVKESGLPGRHVQVILFMVFWTRVIQPRRDGKDCASLPPKEWGRTSQSFSSTRGWVILHWGRLEPAFGGNRRRFFPAGQSSRSDQCTGHWSVLIRCTYARVSTETRALFPGPLHSHHNHHKPPQPPQHPQPPQPPHRFEQVCVAFCVSFVGRTHAGGPWLLATELTAAQGVPAVAESDDCARG